jgi:hypothetical protein
MLLCLHKILSEKNMLSNTSKQLAENEHWMGKYQNCFWSDQIHITNWSAYPFRGFCPQ